jgi:glycosyl transferase family 1
MKRKICVITEPYHVQVDSKDDVNRSDFHRSLSERFTCEHLFFDGTMPSLARPSLRTFDAIFVYVRFRLLNRIQTIDWAGFDGPRILYDEDSYLNRCHARLGGRSLLGHWDKAIKRLKFTDIITTDYHFRQDFSVPHARCHWLPKYFNPHVFFPQTLKRSQIGYFGATYDARHAMLTSLEKNGASVEIFRCPHEELNTRLNRLLGCVICNLATGFQDNWIGKLRRLTNRIPRLRAWVHTLTPQLGVRYEPTIGTMFKNFEIPAAGCAPIADWSEELSVLGYIDGETAVVYHNFDELAEKVQYYLDRPEELETIGKKAQAVTQVAHSLPKRIDELAEIIEQIV